MRRFFYSQILQVSAQIFIVLRGFEDRPDACADRTRCAHLMNSPRVSQRAVVLRLPPKWHLYLKLESNYFHSSASWCAGEKHLRDRAAPSFSSHILPLPPSLLQDWGFGGGGGVRGGGAHSACWPWWLEDPSHPLFCLCCNKVGCFSLLLQKNSPKDPPLRIVAFPCIDVWLLVHIHLLFYALDFKENERGPIMLIGSCSVKRNQTGLLR